MHYQCMRLALAVIFIPSGMLLASSDSIGPNGINSAGLLGFDGQPLTGAGVAIGQVELARPGKSTANMGPDDPANANSAVVPKGVYLLGGDAVANQNLLVPDAGDAADHAEQVASVMISTDPITKGVSPGAQLYAGSDGNPSANFDEADALTSQHIIDASGGQIRALNMSIGNPLVSTSTDGNALLTLFIDWSASKYNILYVVAGPESEPAADHGPIPSDNYNGMTISASTQVMLGQFRQVSELNQYGADVDAFGDRTSVKLLAPGELIDVSKLGNNNRTIDSGTSFAAPHVTGTVALLQQYANQRFPGSDPHWTADAGQHEVMKAILVNSADKIQDTGNGDRLGMEKTIVDIDDTSTWLDSPAYTDVGPGDTKGEIPLDLRMGAGQLNAKRALNQFSPGEYHANSGTVPVRAWDYGSTSGDGAINKYVLNEGVLSTSFISITLAWDRRVVFDNDANGNGKYDIGDTFVPDCCFANLDLYLMPAGATSFDDAITSSVSKDPNDTLEHIFFQIPSGVGGNFEIWVTQTGSQFNDATNYALAWWAKGEFLEAGDFNGDGVINAQDYAVWKTGFGSTVTPGTSADGNGDGKIDASDYVVWRDAMAAGSGAGSAESVPEPNAAVFLSVVFALSLPMRRRSA